MKIINPTPLNRTCGRPLGSGCRRRNGDGRGAARRGQPRNPSGGRIGAHNLGA